MNKTMGIVSEHTELINLSKVISSLSIVTWISDLSTNKFIYINEIAESLFHCSLNNCYQREASFYEYVHPDDQQLYREKEQDLLKKGCVEFEYRIMNRECVKWIYTKRTIAQDKKSVKGIEIDITNSKTHENFSQKPDLAPDNNISAIVITDKEGCIEWVNQGFELITGYSSEEIKGKKPESFLHGEDTNSQTVSFVNEKLKSLEPVREEILNYKKDKTPYWISLDALPLFNEQGEHEKFIFLGVDVTTKKQKETEQDKSLREFGHIASSNLRKPITTLLELIDSFDKSELLSESNQKLFDSIKESALSVDDSIKDLNKIIDTKNTYKEAKEWVNLNDELQVVLNALGVKNPSFIKVNFEVNKLFSIKSYINSIFYNLIFNAIKYQSPDRALEIEISSGKIEHYAYIMIADNGLGTDLENQENDLSKMYKRFHTSVSGKKLSLELVKTQIEALGGKIEFNSIPNQRTCFKIYLKQLLNT